MTDFVRYLLDTYDLNFKIFRKKNCGMLGFHNLTHLRIMLVGFIITWNFPKIFANISNNIKLS
jgi:hypothetical protein